jgi:hypothetical protein
MFHPHQDAIAEAGCMGLFDVIESWLYQPSSLQLVDKNSQWFDNKSYLTLLQIFLKN